MAEYKTPGTNMTAFDFFKEEIEKIKAVCVLGTDPETWVFPSLLLGDMKIYTKTKEYLPHYPAHGAQDTLDGIAYVDPKSKKVLVTKIGRFVRKAIPDIKDNCLQNLVSRYKAARKSDEKSEFSHKIFSSPEEIRDCYVELGESDDSRMTSCMTKPGNQYENIRHSDWEDDGAHPTLAYGGDSKVDLIVVYRNGKPYLRSLRYNNKLIRVYPSYVQGSEEEMIDYCCTNTVDQPIISPNYPMGSLEGATLNIAPLRSDGDMILVPYIDGDAYIIDLDTGKVYEDMPGYIEVEDDNARYVDTHEDRIHEKGAVDITEVEGSYDCRCDSCNEGIHYEEGNYHTAYDGNYTFCSSNCASNEGYYYAHVDRHDMELVNENSESLYEYDGELYTIDGLDGHNLVIDVDGDIIEMDEAVQCESDGEWYHTQCVGKEIFESAENSDTYKLKEDLNIADRLFNDLISPQDLDYDEASDIIDNIGIFDNKPCKVLDFPIEIRKEMLKQGEIFIKIGHGEATFTYAEIVEILEEEKVVSHQQPFTEATPANDEEDEALTLMDSEFEELFKFGLIDKVRFV